MAHAGVVQQLTPASLDGKNSNAVDILANLVPRPSKLGGGLATRLIIHIIRMGVYIAFGCKACSLAEIFSTCFIFQKAQSHINVYGPVF